MDLLILLYYALQRMGLSITGQVQVSCMLHAPQNLGASRLQ